MRCEIGSEFWNVPVSDDNNFFLNETRWFASGRSALYAIIRENHFKTVLLPDFCCDSMIKPFIDSGITVRFYPAFSCLEDLDADAALIMDCFGYTGHSGRGNFKGIVIRDLTHSVFSTKYDDADYYFGSLRKWAGFYTGGFAWGLKQPVAYEQDLKDYVALRQVAMEAKAAYISGQTDSKDYLNQFSRAEDMLEELCVAPACNADVERAKMLDIDSICKQRRSNASILLNAFSDIAIFPEMRKTDCPLFVPILVDDRDALRRHLIEKEIYCPVHWPISECHKLSKETEAFYNRELSLVCDQRYTEQDMLRMVDVIKEFLRKEKRDVSC